MSRFLRFFRVFAVIIACAFGAFSAQAYKITLDDGDAKFASNPSTYTASGSNYSISHLTDLPYKPGYAYAGHYKQPNCGDAQKIDYQGNIIGTYSGNQKLYPCWVPILHTDWFDGGDLGWLVPDVDSGQYHMIILQDGTGMSRSEQHWRLMPTSSYKRHVVDFTDRDATMEYLGDWVLLGHHTKGFLDTTETGWYFYTPRSFDLHATYWFEMEDFTNNRFTHARFNPPVGFVLDGGYFTSGTNNGSLGILPKYTAPYVGTCTSDDERCDLLLYNVTDGSQLLRQLDTYNYIEPHWSSPIFYVNLDDGPNYSGTPAEPSLVYLNSAGNFYDTFEHAKAGNATGRIYTLTTRPQNGDLEFLGYFSQMGTEIQVVKPIGSSYTPFINGDRLYNRGMALFNMDPHINFVAPRSYWANPTTWATLEIDDQGATTSSGYNADNTWYSLEDVKLYSAVTGNYCMGGYRTQPDCDLVSINSVTKPVKDGWVFGGYYTAINGGGEPFGTDGGNNIWNFPSDGINQDTTIYAKWTTEFYPITLLNGSQSYTIYEKYNDGWYRKNGNQYVEITNSIFSPTSIGGAGLSEPSGNGDFRGYYNAQGVQVIQSNGVIIADPLYDAPTTFTARFSDSVPVEIRLDISDDASWGDCDQHSITVVPGGEFPILECTPTMTGYYFNGYIDNETEIQYYGGVGVSNPGDASYPIVSVVPDSDHLPQELQAKWSRVVNKLGYNCDDQYVHGEQILWDSQYVMWDGAGVDACANTAASSSQAGRKLFGWNVKENPNALSARQYQVGEVVDHWPFWNGGQYAYSVFKPIYYVNLNHAGNMPEVPLANTPSPNFVYFSDGKWYRDNLATDQITQMDVAPQKVGYNFNGYETASHANAGAFNNVSSTFINSIGVQLYAKWSPKVYRVDLESGGSGGTERLFYRIDMGWYTNDAFDGQSVTRIIKPTSIPSGKVFGGYYTAPNGGGERAIDADGNILYTGTGASSDAMNLIQLLGSDQTLYVKWDDEASVPEGENEKFIVHTTSMSANARFAFSMSAAGDFYVQWDANDDSTIQHIGRDNTNLTTYEHTYSAAAPDGRNIVIWGTPTGYNGGSGHIGSSVITFAEGSGTPLLVAEVSGSLGGVFRTLGNGVANWRNPSFYWTFSGCSNLNSLPENLFGYIKNGNYVGVIGSRPYMFAGTFENTGLTSIPGNLFGRMVNGTYNGVSGAAERMFEGAFHGTNITSIPSGLFAGISGAADYMFATTFAGTNLNTDSYPIPGNLFAGVTGNAEGLFASTFVGCANLKTVPSNLFSSVSGAAKGMFGSTFMASGLTSLPRGLFSGVTGTAESIFHQTFSYCSGLAGKYIPKDLFNLGGLTYNANNSMMAGVFDGTNLATSCDAFNLTHYPTDYDNSYWGGKVICAPAATFSCFNTVQGVGNGTPNPSVVWSDEVTSSSVVPAYSSCTAEHYTTTDWWSGTGNTWNHPAVQSGDSLSWLSNLTSSIKYEVYYDPIEYHVALNANGGDFGSNGVQTLYEKYNTKWATTSGGTAITSLNANQRPSRSGYTFTGYYDDPDEGEGNQMVDQNGLIVASTTTLTDNTKTWYAHWQTGPYTVTFKCDTGGNPITGYVYNNNVNYGTSINVPATSACSKTGHTFTQWKIVTNSALIPVASNGSTYTWNHYFGSDVIPDWTPVQTTITLDENGGTWGNNVPNEGQSVYTIWGAGVYRDAARTESMETYGNPWLYVSGSQNNTVSKSVTLTYDLGGNDATLTSGGQTYTGSASFQWPLGFTGFYAGETQMIRGRVKTNGQEENLPGYITPAGLNESTGGPSYTTPQTWYAHWSPITFAPPLTVNVPVRPGYVFLGWYTAANGGDQIADGNGHLDCDDCVIQTVGANTTWYAHWTECSHDFGSNPHASKEPLTAVDGMCRYHITCYTDPGVPLGAGYSQYGGTNTTGEFDFTISPSSTDDLPGCLPRVYNIEYHNVEEHGGTMPSGDWYTYTYGGKTINVEPTSPTEVFDSWCDDLNNASTCSATKTIGATEYDDKIYHAKWRDECKTGYTRYNFESFQEVMYAADGGYTGEAFGNNIVYGTPANICVPIRYHVNCDKNCDGDTCAACLEDFNFSCLTPTSYTDCIENCTNQLCIDACMQNYGGDQQTGWHFSGGYSVADFLVPHTEFWVMFDGGYAPVRANGNNWTALPHNFIANMSYVESGYTWCPQGGILDRLYSDGLGWSANLYTGNYKYFINSVANEAYNSSNTTPFNRAHYTFDGLWTEADGGIQYIDGNGNFANGNLPGYDYLPWPNYHTVYGTYEGMIDAARQFQNFFFDNQIQPSSTSPYTFNVYAHWIPDVYSVQLMKNDGTNTQVGNIYEKYGEGWAINGSGPFDPDLQLSGGNLPSRSGYTFAGYYTQAEGGDLVGSFSNGVWTLPTNTKYLTQDGGKWYAHWNRVQTTITLDNANATTNGTASLTSEYGVGAYLNVNGTPTLMTTDGPAITLPQHNGYTVSFNMNYTGATGPEAQTVSWLFKGYFNSANGSRMFIDSDGKITSTGAGSQYGASGYTADQTWYAQWTEQSTIELPSVYDPAAGYFGRPNHLFNGWWTAANGGTKAGDSGDEYTPSADTILYADWNECSYTGGANGTVAPGGTYGVGDDNSCVYTLTCNTNYACPNGNATCTIYGEADNPVVMIPDCTGSDVTITYYDNPAYGTTDPLHTQGYTYNSSGTVTLWTPGADILAAHHASSVVWCHNSNGTNCEDDFEIPANSGNVTLYAKWTCATGYMKYGYDTLVNYLYTGTGGFQTPGLFAAGTCSPIRYHVSCHDNCPAGETCNACLEDFNLNSANYHFGGGYDVQEFEFAIDGMLEFPLGGYVPVRYLNGFPYAYGTRMAFAQNYPAIALGFAAEACEVGNLAGCMYNESDAGNYKTFLMNISDFPENNGLDFGATHYTFDGLYAMKNGVEVPYIDANGNFANGNSQGYDYLPWPIGYTDTAGLQAAHVFQNFFFDNEIPVSSSPFPDAPYTFDVYAHWKPKEYTINLDKNGGNWPSGAVKKIKEKWGASEGWLRVGGPVNWYTADQFTIGQTTGYNDGRPTRDGYTFMGYYTEQQTGTTCPGTQIIKADGTLNTTVSGISNATYFDNENGSTLYACWESMTYNISYEPNGGTLGADAPTSATYGAAPFHVSNPTHPHGTFKGWYITDMQAEIQHNYGPTNAVEYNTSASVLNLSQNENGTNMQWFQDLRKNNSATVLFTAIWECDDGYSGADCSTAGTYTITIRPGHGIASVSGDGWTNNGYGAITRTFSIGTRVPLYEIVRMTKNGYYTRPNGCNSVYRLADGSVGELDEIDDNEIGDEVFIVGAGNATIYIDAEYISLQPVVEISGGATKVFNYQDVTLAASVTNASAYDSGISFKYTLEISDTENGNYASYSSIPEQDSNSFTILKDDHHGTKYYKIQVRPVDNYGTAVMPTAYGISTSTSVTLNNAPVTFNVSGGTLTSGSVSPLYVSYNVNGNLYSTPDSGSADTIVAVPSATRDNYTFAGWYTSGGTRVYDANGNLTSANVSGYVNAGKWVVTDPNNGVTLYAHWEPKIYEVVLGANSGTDGSVTKIYEKYNTGWSTSNTGTFGTLTLSGGQLPTREGYTFIGFYDASGNQKGIYSNGVWTAPGATTVTGATTWYAYWTANTYQIQYNLNNGQTRDNTSANYNQTTGPIANPTPVNNGTYHQESFAGWNVTNMQSGITHYYGTTSSNLTDGGTGTNWNYGVIGQSIKYFKNLRADTDAVLFEAVWNCVYPYQGVACDTTGGVTVTVNAGNGIASVNGGTGWTGNGTGTITRTVAVGTQIDLSNFATAKAGYTGRAYVKTSDAGTLSDGTFTVGAGDTVININAAGIEAPSVTLSPVTTNQIYNYQPVTLTATATRSDGSEYAQGITFAYEFAEASSISGPWNYVTSANNGTSNTKNIDKDEFLGVKFYRARVTASGEGNLSSDSAESNRARVVLNQKQLRFNANGGTLGSTSGRYIRYDSEKLYAGATDDSEINVPGATWTVYDFDGWFTDAEGGNKIYDADLTLAYDDVDEWIGDGVWKSTVDRNVYAHWTPKIFTITLNRNGATNGTAKFYEKYGEGYASTESATNWVLTRIAKPAKVGYDFAGYYDTEDFSGTMIIGTDGKLPMTDGVVDPTYFTQDTTLYAKWEGKQYTVTYDCNGNGGGNTQGAEYDTNFTVRTLEQANCNTSVPGYTFGGWTVTPAGGTRQPGDVFTWKYTANQTFTAIWTNNNYTLTYACGDGATGNAPSQQTGIHYQDTVSVSGKGGCNKTGHSFTGWAVSGTNDTITATTWPHDITWNYEESKIFTAQWDTDEYDIDYDENGGSRLTLPDGYTLLEYVSGGTFDTGLNIGTDNIFEIKYATTEDSTAYQFGYRGASGSTSSNSFHATYSSGSQVALLAVNSSSNAKTFKATQTIDVLLTIRWNGSVDIRPTANGAAMSVSGSTTEQTNPSQTFVIGGEKINGTVTKSSKVMKIYYFRTFDSDGVSVTHNFVPVKNSSNVIGMYDTITGTFLNNRNDRTPTGPDATDTQVIDDAYPESYTYGVGAKVYGVPTRAHSVFVGWCEVESSNSNGPTSCQTTMPYTISTTATDDKTLHAKWNCEDGYTQSSDKQSCVGKTITLDWQENNGNYADLANGQCTYGGNLTLPGVPPYDANHVFNGWKTYGTSGIFVANAEIAGGCVQTYTGVTSGTSTAITAKWCPACNPTHATCTLDASEPGTCSYVTSCNTGYHLSPDSQLNVYNTVCIPYTITYQSDGHGDGATDDVLYNSTFTTNDAKNSSQFNWNNHIVTEWTRVSGGNFPNLDTEYPYNVQSDTVLKANWGECHCTAGTGATSCDTISSNNACEVNVIVCDTGFTGSTWSCDGINCTATCNNDNRHTITLNKNNGTGGTTTLYTISGTGSDAGVYINSARTNRMTPNPNGTYPITAPTLSRTVSYDITSNGTVSDASFAQQPTSANTSAVATFNGYYISKTGTEKYIESDRYINATGVSKGKGYTTDKTWYAQWTYGSVTLPIAYRPGYTLSGWSTTVGGTSVGNAGDSYTTDSNVTLYPVWTQCAAGTYCPGVETVNNQTVYNVVNNCPTNYPNSAVGSTMISDCYLVLTPGKYVSTAGNGMVNCTQNYYCDDNTTKVYYSDPGDGRRTTGVRKSCATNAGSFSLTDGVGKTNINECYKNVTLNKRGGSGTLGGASGTDDGSAQCFYNQSCTLPDASILELTGYTFHAGWTDQPDTDCNSTTRVFVVPDDTDTYYACRTMDIYNVTLKDGQNTGVTFATVNVNYDSPMPDIDSNGNDLVVPTHSPVSPNTTHVFKGYFSTSGQSSSSGTQYYKADLTSAHNWTTEGDGTLYAKWYMKCDPGYYLPAGSYACAACPAGRYCVGGSAYAYSSTTDKGLSGYIAAGYYSTGGASVSTPTGSGDGCATGYSCGIVAGGYYSTGGGTSATPTAAGNGCLSGSGRSCGKVAKNYFSNGGGKTSTPTATGCVTGQFCGICPATYRSNSNTGKASITECVAACAAGTQVATAEDPTVNNAEATGCTTPKSNNWWSNAHNVNYGSASPTVTGVNENGVHMCATNYNTPNTGDIGDHDHQHDCKRRIILHKNGGTTVDGAVWPDNVTDSGGAAVSAVCYEDETTCAFGNPAELLEETGYTFQNQWGTDTSCANPVVSPVANADISSSRYYACRNHDTYTLTYACGDGATGDAPDPWTGHYHGSITVSDHGDCVKIGHTFADWAVTPAGETQQPGAIAGGWPYLADQTFTAQWTPDTYNISYVVDNGVTAASLLPDGYTQLEYIESDGNQYIRTNFIPNSDFKHTIVFEGLSGNSNAYIAGTSSGATGRAGNIRIDGSYIDGVFGNNDSDGAMNLVKSSAAGAVPVLNRKSVLVMDLHNNATNSIMLNGVQIANTSTARITSTARMSLFALNSSYRSIIRLYSDTIEQNGVLVHNYVPAQRDEDDEIGLYDTVTGEFFTNQGSGTFVPGNPVTTAYPNQYTYGVGATVTGGAARANSVFQGWCRTALLTDCAAPHEITTTDIDDIRLYAKWGCATGYHNVNNQCVANEFTLVYNANGHGTAPNNQTCTYGQEITLRPALVATGWNFGGWNIANHTFFGEQTIVCNEGNLGVTGGAIETTVNITADWSASCNQITLNKNSNSASWTTGSVTALYAKTRENGSTTNGKWYKDDECTIEYTSADYENIKPIRSGWTFRGFYANSSNAADISATQTNGVEQHIDHTGAPTSTGQTFINGLNVPATLYAGWARDCKDPVAHGTCRQTIGQNTTYTTLCDTGYHYDPAASESTYNPICVPNTITFILDKNGGTGTCGGQTGTAAGTLTCDYDGTCNTPVWSSSNDSSACQLTKDGKIFAGWSTTADGTGAQSCGTTGTQSCGTATVAGDVQNMNDGTTSTTLYAVWKDVVCNVINGSATSSVVRGNKPRCSVSCNTGYRTSGGVFGEQHSWVVDTGQCDPMVYNINYELYGGNRVDPNGYTLLQYVTADGNQYFDTGIAIKKSYEIRSKFMPTATDKFVYGVRNTNDTASVTAYTANWRWGNKTVSVSSLISLNNLYDAVQNVNGVTLNGTTTTYETQNADFTTTNTLILGTARTASGTLSSNRFIGNIYEFRILDGNRNDLMNLVPAQRDNDGAVGFYDTVSGEFFTSDSGTDFEAGPAIYTLLDYIQSDGTSYINLGFKANSAMRIETEFQHDSTQNDAPFGVYGYGGNLAFYTGAANANSYFYGASKIDLGVKLNTTNWHSVVVDGAGGEIVVDGISTPYSPSTFTQTSNMVLFARRHNSSGYGMLMTGKVRYFRVYDNGTLYFNGLPARNSSGVVGIYDTISGNFFTGVDSSAFSGGTEFGSAYPEHYVYGVGTSVYGVPVRANSVFEGWCRDAALTDGCTIVPHVIGVSEIGVKTLHAKWSCVDGYYLDGNNQCVGNTITINYQNGGHGGTPPFPGMCTYGGSINLADAMGAVGYVFSGWELNGEVYDEEERISCNYDTLGVYSGNVTAVAVWDSQQYTVTYDCNTPWTPNNAPASQNVQTDGLVTVKRNTCVNPGYRFVKWAVSGTNPQEYKNEAEQFTWRYTENKTFSAVWEIDDTDAFTVTVDMPANTEFKFNTIATGQFWVNWDDGSNIEEYAPTTITTKTWTHTYTTAGTYDIKIGGRATGYAVSGDGTPETKPAISFFNGTLDGTGVDATVTASGTEQYITAVSGKLGAIFPTITAGSWGGQPRFYRTFKNTTAMTVSLQSIADLFDGISGVPVHYMFAETFDGSAVTGAIPAGLFPVSGAPKTALFLSTFRNCTGLTGTIPANLFVNISGAPAVSMFGRTFRGCTGLAGIPAGLFRNINGAPAEAMFYATFLGCTNITGTLSSNLFGNLNGPIAKDMFRSTFYNCTSLVGDASDSTVAIPNGMFGTLTASTTAATRAFYATFYGCAALRGKIGGALFGGLTGNPAEYMFSNTFNTCGDRDITTNCSNLNGAIPSNLFGNMTGAPKQHMFNATFKGASGLTGSIPSRLFGGITGVPASNMFRETFYGCSGLTGTIPANLFAGISGAPAASMFYRTFGGCSHLSEIGGALFSGISGPAKSSMFFATFAGCSRLHGSIPNGLFGAPTTPASWMFGSTFYGCSGLTGEIPSDLFSSVDGSAADDMFYRTFDGCGGLTGTIPSNLFGNLSGDGKEGMFYRTFYNCSNLTGYVPEGLFGTMTKPSTVPTNMMIKVFAGSGLDTVCPCGTTKVDSVFETYWDSLTDATTPDKVSCRVGLKPGEHWYNGVCTTTCSDTAIDELHVGNLDPYVVLADPVLKYGNTVYHADRPNDTPPAGFGQR